ncbi:MAG: alpha/beta fold hydrolase [Solirubrobacterales bacterium]|jgi:3-oxoadipate enol-lactonase|nr:alpha/beta fold hydrolase [Solirubrobacterales bacterium]
MATATVNGTELFHELRGRGEPLLLIQGMSGTHASWGEPFRAALDAAGFETVAYDHRGIGFSAAWRTPFTLAQLAEDAAGVMDAVGWESAHVLGISMGGMVAQELALAHPERVRTLALGCTYSGGPGSVLTNAAVAQELGAAMMSGDRERALRAGYEVNVSKAFAAEESNWTAFREMATSVPAPLPTIMLQMQAIAGHDTSARLASINAPTLVVHGTEDRMLQVVNGRAIAAAIPGARLEELEGVGHMFWWEQPARSAELVAAHALG